MSQAVEEVVGKHRSGAGILVVCRANLCRSPAAEFLLGRELRAQGLDWRVSSAGTTVSHDVRGMCPVSASIVAGANPEVLAWGEEHQARQVTAALLENSALVLTASIEERSAVARLAPAVRPRTFTLVEAALLTSYAVDVSPGADVADLRSFARLLHQHRGRGTTPAGGRRARRKDSPVDDTSSLDVQDAHELDGPSHDAVMARTRWAIDHLAVALFDLFALQHPASAPTTTRMDGS